MTYEWNGNDYFYIAIDITLYCDYNPIYIILLLFNYRNHNKM